MLNAKFRYCGCLINGNNDVVYTLAVYCGHFFRVYPDGHIRTCTAEDKETARYFLKWSFNK